MNLAGFSLNSTPVNFNFADFNVYVLISSFSSNWTISDMAVAEGDASAVTPVAVTDIYAGPTGGRVVEFNISGASAGDTFNIAATSAVGTDYIEGVSFQSVPEPSTYAMMLGGMGLLVLCLRSKLA